jgi:hypothetical protein
MCRPHPVQYNRYNVGLFVIPTQARINPPFLQDLPVSTKIDTQFRFQAAIIQQHEYGLSWLPQ